MGHTIQNCNFTGVKYDAKAVEAIVSIANGLGATATALGKLADVLKASNVTIETMISMKPKDK